MIETNIFEQWLDAEAGRVGQKLANNQNLTPDDKLTIVIKGLTNHVAHLDLDLRGEIAAVSAKLREESASLRKDIAAARSELKSDIAEVRAELREESASLRKDIAAVRSELKNDIAEVRSELKNDIAEVRSELKNDIAEVRSDVNKRFEKLEADVKDLRREVVDIHKALNGQVWKIVGALSLLGTAAGAAGYILKLWR